MSIGKEKEPAEQISGSFTMQIQDDRSIDFHINMAGQGAFSTKDVGENEEYTAEGKAFLKEGPVAPKEMASSRERTPTPFKRSWAMTFPVNTSWYSFSIGRR